MTHDQLGDYINTFQPHQREAICKQIIDSELLAKAFETSEGKQILNSAVDLITSNVMQIVKSCNDATPEVAMSEVYQYAVEIQTTYKLIKDWANILTQGRDHKEKAENIK